MYILKLWYLVDMLLMKTSLVSIILLDYLYYIKSCWGSWKCYCVCRYLVIDDKFNCFLHGGTICSSKYHNSIRFTLIYRPFKDEDSSLEDVVDPNITLSTNKKEGKKKMGGFPVTELRFLLVLFLLVCFFAFSPWLQVVLATIWLPKCSSCNTLNLQVTYYTHKVIKSGWLFGDPTVSRNLFPYRLSGLDWLQKLSDRLAKVWN